jgi:cell division initiation protein
MERFNSSFKGYNINEVNQFVDEMTREYSSIIDKLKQKDAEILRLTREIEDLKQRESKNSIGQIYSANEEMTRLAKHEAKTIIDDAKKNASRIVNDALLEAEKIEMKSETLRRNMIVFKRRMRAIVKTQLDTIDDMEDIKLED